ncbi:synaptotagmin-7 [Hydra vulgaris]|uniref:synaptotagmin-7 n=1 Tax=Hydra vulgaris TaxID=6087 RepID=UPI000192435B|nr:synaptotagmin-7 [Hydra vulgaris]
MLINNGHLVKEIQQDKTFLTSVIITAVLGCIVIVLIVVIMVMYVLIRRKKKNGVLSNRKFSLPHKNLDRVKTEMPYHLTEKGSNKYLTDHSRKVSIPQQVFAASVPFKFPISVKSNDASFNKTVDTNSLYQKGLLTIGRRKREMSFTRSVSVPTVKDETLFNEDEEKMWLSSLSMMGVSPEVLHKNPWNGAYGKVKFSLYYNRKGEYELEVKLHEFDDLPLSRESGISVPFVKIYLYPQTDHAYTSQNINKQNSRVEVLSFPHDTECIFAGYTQEIIQQMALKFVILDYDRFSRSEFVAECVILLDEEPLDGKMISKYLSIKKTQATGDLGSLLISLCYQPNGNQVCIVILKATGLPDTEGKLSDHFVKIKLLQNGNILDKRRTHVIKKNTCPVFNEKLIFPVDDNVMRNLVIVFDVVRQESKIKHEKVGSVILANHSLLRQVTPHEIQHFNEMLQSPQRQIAEWHKIV